MQLVATFLYRVCRGSGKALAIHRKEKLLLVKWKCGLTTAQKYQKDNNRMTIYSFRIVIFFRGTRIRFQLPKAENIFFMWLSLFFCLTSRVYGGYLFCSTNSHLRWAIRDRRFLFFVTLLPAFVASMIFVAQSHTCGEQFATAGFSLLWLCCPHL